MSCLTQKQPQKAAFAGVGKLFVATIFLLACFCTSCSHNDEKPRSVHTTRLPIPTDPSTLDPRLARSLPTIDVVRLLFTGLFHLSPDGRLCKELAKSIETTDNGLSYHIIIKKAHWSDGEPITVHDFIYSWKTMLDKNRAAPNAFQLFWIKNAKSAFDGKVDVDAIGLKPLNETEFIIELERPCPFLEKLLATPAFLAVQKKYDQAKGTYGKDDCFPTNGPFCVHAWIPQTSLELVKNRTYIFSNNVHQDRLHFSVVEDTTAMTMFEGNELDWAGSPTGTVPVDSIPILKQKNSLYVVPAAGTAFLRINVTKSPLQDKRIRKACSLVIDRQAIVDHILQGGQTPATTLVPPCMTSMQKNLPENRIEQAQKEVLSYCRDHVCTPQCIAFSLSFSSDPRSLKVAQAIQHDIMSHLHFNVSLQPCDPQQFYAKISSLSYDMALGSWYADYFDPHGFYSVFEQVKNGTNNTGWESTLYQALIQQSLTDTQRALCFEQMEALLSEELPIIPLYHGCFNYVKNPTADGISISPLGLLDVTERT